MARSSTTFKKRQKELARQDKARGKTEKRMIRKAAKQTRGPASLDDAIDYNASIYDFVPNEYNPDLVAAENEEENEEAAPENPQSPS